MSKMSREDLFREIGEIDEKYVKEAEQTRRKPRAFSWVGKMLVAAASLVFCVGVGYMTVLFTQPRGNTGGAMDDISGSTGSALEAAQEPYSMAEDTAGQRADNETGGEMGAERADQEAALGEAPAGQVGQEAASEEASAGQADQEAASKEASAGQADQEAASKEASAGQADQEAAPEEAPDQRYDELTAASGTESGKVQGATGQIQEDKEEKDREGMEDVLENCLQQTDDEAMVLTWEAARTDGVYGRYIDVQIPEGYNFTSGSRSTSALCVTWNKGLEEIWISCRQADEGVSDWLVDVEKPEEYDLGLYTIPWCDSVPQELVQKVSNAIFQPGQITPEIVAARTYQAREAGDMSGSRTHISILYNDNVLVEISSKGPSAEEIYAMINLENQI